MNTMRKLLAMLLTAAMLCLMIPVGTVAAASDNFIFNGDFEIGNTYGWSTYQGAVVTGEAAKEGSFGIHVKGNGGWGGMLNQSISGLEVGKTYRFSFWYKTNATGVNVKLTAGSTDTGTTYGYIYATKNVWTQFAVEFEALEANAFLNLCGSGTGQAESMYMDCISLTEVVLGGDDSDPNLKMIDTIADRIKTQGRTAMVGGTLMLDFTISGIEFTFQGSGDVYATFNARKISNSSAEGGIYFTIIVDGVAQPRDYCRITSVGETKVLLAEDLPEGRHTFAIYRQSEHSFGEVGICALSYDGTIWKGTKGHNYIEFIGDSISCGFGNLGTNGKGDGAALWSDGTQAYPFLTAQAVCADWSNVSWSGLGCKYGYSTTTMQDVYPAQRYNYDQTTAYDFSKRTPNVIVLALGTNDNSCQANATLKRAGLVEMLTLVREKNPGVPIVWIYNMMTSGVNSMIEDIVAEFGGAEENLYTCKLTMNTSGGGYHPNLAGQQKFADELSAFLLEKNLVEIPEYPVPPSPPDDIVLSGGETARMEMTDDMLGLAFRFHLSDVQGITMDKNHAIDLTNATISLDHGNYKLLEVGAIVTNDVEIGLRPNQMTRENLSDKAKDVPAVYANSLSEEGLKYAVRVTNIPSEFSDAHIYARGYYVYQDGDRTVTAYGEIYVSNYDNNVTTNDGIFDW